MRKGLALGFALLLAGLACVAQAQMTLTGAGAIKVASTGGTCTPGTEASAFLARTSGLDTPHTTAYCNLINGLVADAVFSSLDALYVYATDTFGNAGLSLVSATYNTTVVGTPAFAANAGYTPGMTAGVVTDYTDSNFNPTTAGSPKYTQNSATLFIWSNTSSIDVTNNKSCATIKPGTPTSGSVFIYPRATDGNAYFGVQDPNTYTVLVASSDGSGFFSVDRSTSTAVAGYKNGSSVATGTPTSSALVNGDIIFSSDGFTNNGGCLRQLMAGGFGQSLGGAKQAALYARLHTYLQVIAGIP